MTTQPQANPSLQATEGTVTGLFLGVARGEPMQPVAVAEALEGRGLAGCRHAKKASGGKRQVLLMDEANPPALGLAAGDLKENISVAGLPLETLPPGQRIAVGGAVVEITEGCVPCQKLNNIRPGLLKESWGKRGQLARVIRSGPIALGDVVRLLDVNPDAPKKPYPKLPG